MTRGQETNKIDIRIKIVICFEKNWKEVIAKCFELENSRLGSPESYFNSISNELRPKRDALVKLLKEAGLEPIVPEGGYFIMADISKVAQNFSSDNEELKDSKFVKYLIKEKVRFKDNHYKIKNILNISIQKLEKGLSTIPVSVFFSNQNSLIGENYIRFCYFKVFISNNCKFSNKYLVIKSFNLRMIQL